MACVARSTWAGNQLSIGIIYIIGIIYTIVTPQQRQSSLKQFYEFSRIRKMPQPWRSLIVVDKICTQSCHPLVASSHRLLACIASSFDFSHVNIPKQPTAIVSIITTELPHTDFTAPSRSDVLSGIALEGWSMNRPQGPSSRTNPSTFWSGNSANLG